MNKKYPFTVKAANDIDEFNQTIVDNQHLARTGNFGKIRGITCLKGCTASESSDILKSMGLRENAAVLLMCDFERFTFRGAPVLVSEQAPPLTFISRDAITEIRGNVT